MAGKGVSPQPNPMELPEAEAKAVFDQLVKEVVVPFFNKFVEAFANVDLTSDADKPISIATQAALDRKRVANDTKRTKLAEATAGSGETAGKSLEDILAEAEGDVY